MEIIFYGDNMRKNKIILFVLFLITILLMISGCRTDNNDLNNKRNEKVLQEMDYLDTQIVSLLNKLNNITLQNYEVTSKETSLGEENSNDESGSGKASQEGQPSSQEQANSGSENTNITISQMQESPVMDSEEKTIDWNEVKNSIEIINDSWAVILLDLSSLNVNNSEILGFSNTLDDTIISIKQENKETTLINLAKLYSYIPVYVNEIKAPNNIKNIKQAKSYLVNAYSQVSLDNWTEVESNIVQCEKTYNNILNDIEYVKDKEYKVNRTYVLINELKNSLVYKDKSLFYVKYKNLLESINTL